MRYQEITLLLQRCNKAHIPFYEDAKIVLVFEFAQLWYEAGCNNQIKVVTSKHLGCNKVIPGC